MKKIICIMVVSAFFDSNLVSAIDGKICRFEKLSAGEISKNDIYAAEYEEIGLFFGNGDISSGDYLKITNNKKNTECSMKNGIWDFDRIYITTDKNFILIGAYSGSSSAMLLYSTNECEMIENIDVYASDYRVETNKLIYNGGCEYSEDTVGFCNPAAVYDLDENCKLSKNEILSKELTLKNYGLSFDKKYTEIKNPKLDNTYILDERY